MLKETNGIKTDKQEKDEIIQKLLLDNKIRINQIIDYAYFKEIYEPYKDKMTEFEFCKILGIGYSNYMNFKNNQTNIVIKDYKNKSKIERIKYIIGKESRYYSKEELEKLSKEYGLSINDIIKHLFCAGKQSEYLEEYKKIIEGKGKIWIGDTKCSKSFAEKHSEIIIKEAEKNSVTKSSRYGCRHLKSDLASDAIAYVLQNCGEIGKNFNENDIIARNLIKVKIKTYIKYKCIGSFAKPKENSFNVKFRNNKGEEKEVDRLARGIEDKKENLQNYVEEKLLKDSNGVETKENEGKIYAKLLMKNMEQGLTLEQALEIVEKNIKVPKKEILETLKNYMILTRKVKQRKNGEFIIGE